VMLEPWVEKIVDEVVSVVHHSLHVEQIPRQVVQDWKQV
jgi:hypothetical protein